MSGTGEGAARRLPRHTLALMTILCLVVLAAATLMPLAAECHEDIPSVLRLKDGEVIGFERLM